MHRSGFACFVGRPNAGKSTLTNAIVGQKVAIASSRPQTTRHAVRGIVTRPDAQLVVTGDRIRVRREGEERIIEGLDPTLAKRVGAPVAQQAYLDHTPAKPPPIDAMTGKVAVRDRGAGRPTKKQRRDLDAFRGR